MSNIDNIRDKNDQELLEELTNINRDMLDLKFKLGSIFTPTFGVTAKKTQLHLSTISWLFFAI